MPIYALPGRAPRIDARCFVAPSADLIGEVTLGAFASVWFGAALRADNDFIRVGKRSNVQDGAVLHVDPGAPLTIGERVTVGHSVMLHGCTVGDNCLVGIGCRVLNHARIAENCIIGAGALITEGKTYPPGSLILGAPARIARELTNDEVAKLPEYAEVYVDKIALYNARLTNCGRGGDV